MLYFDNAATTFPKPECVYTATESFMRTQAGNSSRGTHRLSLATGEAVDNVRVQLAQLFGASSPAQVVFTLNCTMALNMALHGLLEPGDHVITGSMEHNAVIRPLNALSACGVSFTCVPCAKDGLWKVSDIMGAINPHTRLVALSHASNVTGTIQPIEELGALLKERGVLFLVDAAQTAGLLPINMAAMGIDLLAFPGHKELLGPSGTGALIVGEDVHLRPIIQGGTGTRSEEEVQPTDMPESLESGTLNSVGIVALGAGLSFIQEHGLSALRAHQKELTEHLLHGLTEVPGLVSYGPKDAGRQLGVVSVNLAHWEPTDVGVALDQEFDIAVRTGLHCAPLAHRTLGTFPTGTVRLSSGFSTTIKEVDLVVEAFHALSKQWQRGLPQAGIVHEAL